MDRGEIAPTPRLLRTAPARSVASRTLATHVPDRGASGPRVYGTKGVAVFEDGALDTSTDALDTSTHCSSVSGSSGELGVEATGADGAHDQSPHGCMAPR